MTAYAIIPARSGSKGVPDKNIRLVGGKELLAHAVEFATSLGLDRTICSTDSPEYAEVARKYGAEVPFLRSPEAAGDTAMEQDILKDMYDQFERYGMQAPDLFVWLRPTFVFRRRADVLACIQRMESDPSLTACRVVTEAEARLYKDDGGRLVPTFDDHGRSMARRQDTPQSFRVYHTDVFRGRPRNDGPAFLGDRIGYVVAPKLCSLDIDDEIDLQLVDLLLTHGRNLIDEHLRRD